MSSRRQRRAKRVERIRQVFARHMGQLAQAKQRRCYGEVVGITGSIGKSSVKAAVVSVLETAFTVDASKADYNTRLGLLLSMFHQRSGQRSLNRWVAVTAGAVVDALVDRKPFDKLVLEMGVDRPGGMTESLRDFRPDISIFTGVAPVHLGTQQFAAEQAIFEEKAKLVRSMRRGTAILNRDNLYCRQLLSEPLRASHLWYGRTSDDAPLDGLPAGLYVDRVRSTKCGIEARVRLTPPARVVWSTGGSIHHRRALGRASGPLRSAEAVLSCPIPGEHHLYVLLPALLTGLITGIDLQRSCDALSTFRLPPGRMSLVLGAHESTILDSSFNASPQAVAAALDTLESFPADRRLALLGSMNELGAESAAAHRAVGRRIPSCADVLVTVGTEARLIAEEARAHGMAGEFIRSFDTAEEAGPYVRGLLRAGDVILAKGSRHGITLERAIRCFMRDPDDPRGLLVG